MKRSIYLLLLPFLFLSCSDDDNDKQDYTSFVVVNNSDVDFPNCVAGYYTEDGLCIKIAELGNLNINQSSDEIIVENEEIREIYVFTDYMGTRKLDEAYILKNNKKNTFEIYEGIRGIRIIKTDNTQYPH